MFRKFFALRRLRKAEAAAAEYERAKVWDPLTQSKLNDDVRRAARDYRNA